MDLQHKQTIPLRSRQQSSFDDVQIPQGFQLETKLRQLIQEIVDPALKKTEDCVKNIEYFSQVLDSNNKKFDHCYDVYEVLNEKIKIRFNEIDALTSKVAQIDSDQIINNGLGKQESKELRQQIVELKDRIAHKTEQIQQHSTVNEKLQEELVKLNNKILDTKGDYQEKMGDFIKNHFSGFTNIQKEFSKIKEEFVMTNRGMEYHKQVFDELQSTLDLYKVERIDVKKKIESIMHQINEKVEKQDFNHFSERIEHSLVNGNDELRLELQRFQKDSNLTLENHSSLITSLKNNEEVYQQTFKDIHNTINDIQLKTSTAISQIQLENTEMKNEQKVFQKSIDDINASLVSHSNIINETKQNIRKELLKFDLLLNEIKQTQTQVIEEQVTGQIEQLKSELRTEFGDQVKSVTKELKDYHKEFKEFQKELKQQQLQEKQEQEKELMQQQKEKDENIVTKKNENETSLQFSPSDSAHASIQIEKSYNTISQEQVEEMVTKHIDKTVPSLIKKEMNNDNNQKKDIQLMIERSSAILQDRVEQNMKKNMVTESSLTDIKRDILKIEELKNQMKTSFQQMKLEHEYMNEKVEKMTYKLTTLQSDMTIDHEFINGQIKKVIKDKDSIFKTLKHMCVLQATISESINVASAILLQQEFDKKQQQEIFDNQNSTIPSRFYSHFDVFIIDTIAHFLSNIGLVFEVNSDEKRLNSNKLCYRKQNVEKYDLLSHSMNSILTTWENILSQSAEDFIDNTPGKIFKQQIIHKIKFDSKSVKTQTIEKQKVKLANNSELMSRSHLADINSNNNIVVNNQNSIMNKSFNLPSSNLQNQNNQLTSINSAKTQDLDTPERKKKQNNSMSLNHRKLLKNLKDFNQAHLISLQKQITKPQTVEKQFRKQSTSTIQQDLHKINLTFVNNNDTLKNNYTEN